MTSELPNQSTKIEREFVKSLTDLIVNDCIQIGTLSEATIALFQGIGYDPKAAMAAMEYFRDYPIARNAENLRADILEAQNIIERWKQINRWLNQVATRLYLSNFTTLESIVEEYHARYYVRGCPTKDIQLCLIPEAEAGHIEVVRSLVSNPIPSESLLYAKAAIAAILNGHFEIARFLFPFINSNDKGLIRHAILKSDNLEIFQTFFPHAANGDQIEWWLPNASKVNARQLVAYLLQIGNRNRFFDTHPYTVRANKLNSIDIDPKYERTIYGVRIIQPSIIIAAKEGFSEIFDLLWEYYRPIFYPHQIGYFAPVILQPHSIFDGIYKSAIRAGSSAILERMDDLRIEIKGKRMPIDKVIPEVNSAIHRGHVDVIRYFLPLGDRKMFMGILPAAAEIGAMDILTILLPSSLAFRNLNPELLRSALSRALIANQLEVAAYLINYLNPSDTELAVTESLSAISTQTASWLIPQFISDSGEVPLPWIVPLARFHPDVFKQVWSGLPNPRLYLNLLIKSLSELDPKSLPLIVPYASNTAIRSAIYKLTQNNSITQSDAESIAALTDRSVVMTMTSAVDPSDVIRFTAESMLGSTYNFAPLAVATGALSENPQDLYIWAASIGSLGLISYYEHQGQIYGGNSAIYPITRSRAITAANINGYSQVGEGIAQFGEGAI